MPLTRGVKVVRRFETNDGRSINMSTRPDPLLGYITLILN